MPRSDCSWSVRTAAGKVDVRRHLVRALLPDGGDRVITRPEQLHRLEQRHGRLDLAITPKPAGTGASDAPDADAMIPGGVVKSRQANWRALPAPAGLGTFTSPQAQSAVMAAVGDFITPPPAPAPYEPTWTHESPVPALLAGYAEQARGISTANSFRTPAGEDGSPLPRSQWPAEAIVEQRIRLLREMDSQLFGGASLGHWGPTWCGPDLIPQSPTSSGYKLHVAATSNLEIFEALLPVLPYLQERELDFKWAGKDTTCGPADQALKGLVIYLPSQETLAADIAAIRELLPDPAVERAVPGDVYLGKGLSLRCETMASFGQTLPRKTAKAFYLPAEQFSAGDDAEAAAQLDTWRRNADEVRTRMAAQSVEQQRATVAWSAVIYGEGLGVGALTSTILGTHTAPEHLAGLETVVANGGPALWTFEDQVKQVTKAAREAGRGLEEYLTTPAGTAALGAALAGLTTEE